MTSAEFDSFLQVVVGASVLLAIFNIVRSRKKGRQAVRMAFSCLMFAVAASAYRQEGRFGPNTIACTVVFVTALIVDALLRARRDAS
ncbi:hypothetical protein BH11ARM2_BH11ARM2_34790 [soil metagenome]